MNEFRLVQISDTHLAASTAAADNFDAAARMLAAAPPDLLINTGDITRNGTDSDAELIFARDRHAALGIPWRAIPGNHDLGDSPAGFETPPRQSINSARRARYRQIFGPDFWWLDCGAWRFVGINAQLLESGLPEEGDHWVALEAALGSIAGGQVIGLFVHKPLFCADPDEPANPYRAIPSQSRKRLLALLGRHPLRFVASGHIHQWHHHTLHAVRHIWAPSTAFIVADTIQPLYGEKRLGYLEYCFSGSAFQVTMRPLGASD